MRMTNIIKLARSGELDDLSEKSRTDEKIVGYLNRAVIELYNKYPLSVNEAIVTMVDNKHVYQLDGTDTNVKVNGANIVPYTVMQVTSVYDEVGQLPLNDITDAFSVYTPTYDSIQVSKAEYGGYLSVMFREAHPWIDFIDAGDGVATDTEIRVPRTLLPAVLNYIAFLAYDRLDEVQVVKAEKYLMRFKEGCHEAEMNGLVPTESYHRDVSKKGFI